VRSGSQTSSRPTVSAGEHAQLNGPRWPIRSPHYLDTRRRPRGAIVGPQRRRATEPSERDAASGHDRREAQPDDAALHAVRGDRPLVATVVMVDSYRVHPQNTGDDRRYHRQPPHHLRHPNDRPIVPVTSAAAASGRASRRGSPILPLRCRVSSSIRAVSRGADPVPFRTFCSTARSYAENLG